MSAVHEKLFQHAILIPFRALGTQRAERNAQLRHVVSMLVAARTARQWSTSIVVVQQGDVHPFNRGALLNAGVMWAESACNVILHDCDLLPSAALLEAYDRLLLAAAPAAERPVHLAARGTRYDSGVRFLGGVLGMSRAQFALAGGFPNTLFGWGAEDDELRDRLEHAGVPPPLLVRSAGCRVLDLEGQPLPAKLRALRRSRAGCPYRKEVREQCKALRAKGQRMIDTLQTCSAHVQEGRLQGVPCCDGAAYVCAYLRR